MADTKIPVTTELAQKNKIQTKILSADVTTDTTVSDLTFTGLVVGKWYEVRGLFRIQVNSGGSNPNLTVDITHDSTILKRVNYVSGGTNSAGVSLSGDIVFQATATTLTFETLAASANSFLRGNSTQQETFVQLEERNDLEETSEF